MNKLELQFKYFAFISYSSKDTEWGKKVQNKLEHYRMSATLAGVWMANQPVNAEVQLKDISIHNEYLPPMKDAVVTMTLDNETKTDTVRNLEGTALFKNIPQRYLN